jgi:hypothetical protein
MAIFQLESNLKLPLFSDFTVFPIGCVNSCRPFVKILTEDETRTYFLYLILLELALSLFPSFSLPDVLCDPNDLIWRKRTPFEAMTGRTVPSSHGLLAEVFWSFPQL